MYLSAQKVYADQTPLTVKDDELVTNLSIPNKSEKLFLMSVSEENFKATGHLAVSVHPTSFDSDPDLFIAKVTQLLLINFSFLTLYSDLVCLFPLRKLGVNFRRVPLRQIGSVKDWVVTQ